MKAIIIDDEPKNVSALKALLSEHCPEVEITGIANSAIEAIKEIRHKKPDLIFLDVEMPHGTGFDVLESIPKKNFHVIFVTGYDQYAIRAIKAGALDYLLKPVQPDELIEAVEKARCRIAGNEFRDYEVILKEIKKITSQKIEVPTGNSYTYLTTDEIIRIEQIGDCSSVFRSGKQPLISNQNVNVFEEVLKDFSFFRTDKTHLINLNLIKKFNKKYLGGVAVMQDGVEVRIAARKKKAFLSAMDEVIRN